MTLILDFDTNIIISLLQGHLQFKIHIFWCLIGGLKLQRTNMSVVHVHVTARDTFGHYCKFINVRRDLMFAYLINICG